MTSPPPNGNYSEPLNVKVRSAPAASTPGPPVPSWQSVAWVVVQQAMSEGHRRPGDDSSTCAVPRVVGPNGTTITGLHGGILLPATAPCTKSVEECCKFSDLRVTSWLVTRHAECRMCTLQVVECHKRRESERVHACALWLPQFPLFSGHFCSPTRTPRVHCVN